MCSNISTFVNIVLVFNRLTVRLSFTVFLVDYRANLNRFIIDNILFLEDLMSIAGPGFPRQGALTYYWPFFTENSMKMKKLTKNPWHPLNPLSLGSTHGALWEILDLPL